MACFHLVLVFSFSLFLSFPLFDLLVTYVYEEMMSYLLSGSQPAIFYQRTGFGVGKYSGAEVGFRCFGRSRNVPSIIKQVTTDLFILTVHCLSDRDLHGYIVLFHTFR